MKLVAVTSRPTGITQSRMAAENRERTVEKLGHEIRVEVQGTMGAEDELIAAGIEEADAEGLRNPHELITSTANGEHMSEDESMSGEDEPKLAHGTEPHTALCQRCGDEFEWTKETCPECGWEKSDWVSGGRYGLERSA